MHLKNINVKTKFMSSTWSFTSLSVFFFKLIKKQTNIFIIEMLSILFSDQKKSINIYRYLLSLDYSNFWYLQLFKMINFIWIEEVGTFQP